MQDNTVTLILGITFGFAVVGLFIGLSLLMKAQPVVINGTSGGGAGYTYKNEERWSVVKDADGRVRDIIVHREAAGT